MMRRAPSVCPPAPSRARQASMRSRLRKAVTLPQPGETVACTDATLLDDAPWHSLGREDAVANAGAHLRRRKFRTALARIAPPPRRHTATARGGTGHRVATGWHRTCTAVRAGRAPGLGRRSRAPRARHRWRARGNPAHRGKERLDAYSSQ
jgi:hypothetical protein